MTVPVQSGPVLRYGLAVSAVLLALLLTALLQPLLDRSLFLLFFGAVIISAWYGGVGPALLTIGLSTIACQYVLVNSAGTLIMDPSEDLLRLLVFVLVSLLICALIDARKRTERALQESEARVRRLVESNIVGIIHSNFDGRILEANDAFLNMVDYTREELRAGAVRWDKLTPPEYLHLSERAMESLRASGICPPLEKEYIRKDGSRVPVLIGLALLEGTRDQAMCFVLDLTEKKRAENALRQMRDQLEVRVQEQTAELIRVNEELKSEIREHKQAEQALREQADLLDLTHDTIFSRDIKDVITYWNRGAEALYGWTREEAVGKVSHQLTQTIFPAPFEEIMAELVRTGRWEGELVHRKRDGTQVVVASRWSLQRDEQGRPAAILETNNDITERKRAEMLLAGEKRLLEMIARGDSLALILDVLCRVVEELSSGLLASILLLDPNGKHLTHGAAPSLPKSYIEAIDGLVIGPSVGSCGTAAYRAQQVVVSDIATDPLWADYRDLGLGHGLRACWSTPILSSEGKVLGTFANYYREPRSPSPQDLDVIERAAHLAGVTIERKRAAEALGNMQAELAHVSRTLTMGELVASIAHEVNQPLAAVVTNGSTCLRWLASAEPDIKEVREAVTDIVKDANRASDVIAHIRTFLKKSPIQTIRLDINEVIRDVVELMNSDVLRKKVSLRTKLASTLTAVIGDRVQLQQVLLNLMLNGVEAMGAVSEAARELVILSRAHGFDKVLVAVRDTGVGLDPNNLDRIFVPFFTTKPNGMGMGLSISRSIIEAHGGKLWATPNEDRGTTFHFTIPTR